MSTNPEAISADTPDKRQDVPLDVRAIQALLPHRFPFLLLDRVIEIEHGKRAVAIKNVTVSEPFFQGHFPNVPIMPGVLIIEAMAQLGGVLLMQMAPPDGKEKLALLTGVDKVRFRRKVVPGDQLRLEAEILKIHGVMGKIRTSAHVDGQLVSEGELLFCLAEPD